MLLVLEGEAEGALFLLGFAVGWVSITILTKLFFGEFQWWPLIPGGIMGLISLGLLTDGALLETIGTVGRWWPLILIAIGISIVWQQFRKEDTQAFSEEDEIGYEKGPEDLVS